MEDRAAPSDPRAGRLAPVENRAVLALDRALLASFPEGYRYLGYFQTKLVLTVKRDMSELTDPEIDALYSQGEAWLYGNGEAS